MKKRNSQNRKKRIRKSKNIWKNNLSNIQKQMAMSKAGNLDTYDNGVIKFGDTDEK
jgi:hypothetical protein